MGTDCSAVPVPSEFPQQTVTCELSAGGRVLAQTEFCKTHALHHKTMREMGDLHRQLQRIVSSAAEGPFRLDSNLRVAATTPAPAGKATDLKAVGVALQKALCTGWCDRLARRVHATEHTAEFSKVPNPRLSQFFTVDGAECVALCGPHVDTHDELNGLPHGIAQCIAVAGTQRKSVADARLSPSPSSRLMRRALQELVQPSVSTPPEQAARSRDPSVSV